MKNAIVAAALMALLSVTFQVPSASAHKLRQKGEAVTVADSRLTVTPQCDWNRLSGKPGKNAETWTLDGGQLNDLTFYAGIEAGKPLVKERHKKKDPLPKFGKSTLLVELPELLEGTYRTYKKIGAFQLTSTAPARFLGQDGVIFTYDYTDADQITRKGEATAAIVDGKLYMVSFDAPRLHYFDKAIADVRALVATATL
ncbi:hypothetical protein [Sphingomonas sp. LM7]|uniref:hypothetical protein n=1 Tax=Sphingomonas sp. LM7 TaxID=1938607 RepID=UPI000983C21B|nr:hypothetical protein [Sphingomonas sp. LM7]AQR75419.1 hypothetical protein BXU08_18755 [Sphingomonas sp. LM7]